ncbi:MAG TPA: PIG-L family deacetylase [Acidimicrobiia bacterium]|nr:PIG-L family deacetylase [Acidimicrobiia bacterium]
MPGLLSFHAHPDDESITMGGTLAELADRAVPITVVTATRGEAGEIHNREDADNVRHRLGEIREAEQRAALEVLGVSDLRYLDYRDSGMMGTDHNDVVESFWSADFMEATGRLVRIIREVRPEVLTAYDPFGGYGHPDHIQVHRVGTAAFFGAADNGRYPRAEFGEPWRIESLLWASWSRERAAGVRRAMRGEDGVTIEDEDVPTGFPSTFLSVRRDVRPLLERKRRALLCHDTQFASESWIRALSDDEISVFLGEEVFIRVWGDPGVVDPIGALYS